MESKYKAIIFDLNGTLINSLPYHFLAFKDLLLEHGIRVSDSYLRKLMGISTSDVLKHLKERYKFHENIGDLREERRFHYFKFLGNRKIVYPGVVPMLRRLRVHHNLAVTTGQSKVIFTHSTDKGFQHLFDVVVTINDVERGKPHTEMFETIARKLDLRHGECLVVGDTIFDAIPARKLGMDFIGVRTGFTSPAVLKSHGAISVIRSVIDLEKFLKKSKQ